MTSNFRMIASAQTPPAQEEQKWQYEALQGFPAGLKTVVPAGMVEPTELAECINFQVNLGGQLQSRPGMVKLNTTSLGKIVSLAKVNIEDVVYNLVQNDSFEIFYIADDGSATSVGTALGVAEIHSYGGVAMVLDGGYIKHIDESLSLTVACDHAGKMYDTLADVSDVKTSYTSASAFNVPFTTPECVEAISIPFTKVRLKLGRVGTGAVGDDTITAEIRRVADDVLMASGDCTYPATEIAVDPGDFYYINLDSIIEAVADTEYYLKLVMGSYNSSHYIDWYYESLAIYPSPPPKASFGCIHGRRLWVSGDPDNLSKIYFNNYAPHDWSTPIEAGFITAMDSDKDSYPVGGVATFYGSLFVYGTESWPYLLKVSGDNSEDFENVDLGQQIWTNHKQLVNAVNDIWALSRTGMATLSGVNSYGDVRTRSESASIEDLVTNGWSADSFSEYFVEGGQVWNYIDGRILVANTKSAYQGDGKIVYPWSEYTFGFTPSCFGQWDDLVVGAEDGFIYKPDYTTFVDPDGPVVASIKTRYFQSPFRLIDVRELKVLLDSKIGAGCSVKAYKDGALTTPLHTWDISVPLHDGVTIDDLEYTTIESMVASIDSATSPLVINLSFTCFSYQLELTDITLIGSPVYLNGLVARYRPMED